jgi:hypothetical protein
VIDRGSMCTASRRLGGRYVVRGVLQEVEAKTRALMQGRRNRTMNKIEGVCSRVFKRSRVIQHASGQIISEIQKVSHLRNETLASRLQSTLWST